MFVAQNATSGHRASILWHDDWVLLLAATLTGERKYLFFGAIAVEKRGREQRTPAVRSCHITSTTSPHDVAGVHAPGKMCVQHICQS